MFFTNSFRKSMISLLVAIVLSIGTGAAVAQSGADVWKDGDTGLTWAAKDNGMPISPNEGGSYCNGLKTGGLEWRLPTIDEIETVYDAKSTKKFRTKGTIELSDSCVLTSSTNRGGDTFTFCFNIGSRNIGGGSGCGTTALALCVSGETKVSNYTTFYRSVMAD